MIVLYVFKHASAIIFFENSSCTLSLLIEREKRRFLVPFIYAFIS